MWNNNCICYKKNTLFLKDWIKANIFKVADVIVNKIFISLEELKQKVGTPGVHLEYYVMLNALPKIGLNQIFLTTNKKSKLCFDIGSSSCSASQIRKYIVNDKFDVPKSIKKWNAYLGNQSFNKT